LTNCLFSETQAVSDLFARYLGDASLWVFWAQRRRVSQTVTWENTTWTFWDVYDEQGMWAIYYSTSDQVPRAFADNLEVEPERQQPQITILTVEGITWLEVTWLEREKWVWFYAGYPHHTTVDSTRSPVDTRFRTWHTGAKHARWQLKCKRYRLDQGNELNPAQGVEVEAHYHAPQQTRWQIVYRVRRHDQWTPARALVTSPTDYDDREPAALWRDGKIELFWSSNRSGSWSIWHSTLSDSHTHQWAPAAQLTSNPYSQRAPLPALLGEEMWLIYRANESVVYTDGVETVDFRYAGSTTVDTRNHTKIDLFGEFHDFQTYTYDTGYRGRRTNDNRYAQDTVGIYLMPEANDSALFASNRALIEKTLRQFLPIQVRTVFFEVARPYEEWVYTDEASIEESFFDAIEEVVSTETYDGLQATYEDDAADWVWIRSNHKMHKTVDFAALADLKAAVRFRTCHVGLTAGGVRYGEGEY